ncbi:helix-turn-helix domain-containing protein [Saccharothrix deserti]|uniref:helix-turn-helix domain-containing protein n=1 Tax=Saccharothrix deserti TaxID=2593674 RepID=UPI00131E99B9|nr:helix-turn-helix transcriptional regulator [Saccharothrix deserti]
MEGLAPPEVRDAAEFTAALRAVRVRTGLSFRQLERRAARVGDVLPASTLSTALSRNTLPREHLLAAFIRACGGDDRTVQAWTAIRADLAVASLNPADTAPPTTPLVSPPPLPTPAEGTPAPAAEPTPPAADPAVPAAPAAAESTTPAAAAPAVPAAPAAAESTTPAAAAPAVPAAPTAAERGESAALPAEPPPAVPTTSPAPPPTAPTAPTAPAATPSPDPAAFGAPTASRTRRRLMVVGAVVAVAAIALAVVLTDGLPAGQNAAAPTTSATTTEPSPAPTTTDQSSSVPTTTTPPAESPKAPPPQAPTTTTTAAPAPAPAPQPAPGSPRNGVQPIRVAHTGFCIGEGPQMFTDQNKIVLGQHNCATATPPTELVRQGDGSYLIKLHNAQYGIGCATMDYGGTDSDVLLAGDNCDASRTDQRFTLEPATGGFRLRSVPGAAYCIGVLEGSTDPGVQLIQRPCSGKAHEVFIFG